jgi:hypothetical protein
MFAPDTRRDCAATWPKAHAHATSPLLFLESACSMTEAAFADRRGTGKERTFDEATFLTTSLYVSYFVDDKAIATMDRP